MWNRFDGQKDQFFAVDECIVRPSRRIGGAGDFEVRRTVTRHIAFKETCGALLGRAVRAQSDCLSVGATFTDLGSSVKWLPTEISA